METVCAIQIQALIKYTENKQYGRIGIECHNFLRSNIKNTSVAVGGTGNIIIKIIMFPPYSICLEFYFFDIKGRFLFKGNIKGGIQFSLVHLRGGRLPRGSIYFWLK